MSVKNQTVIDVVFDSVRRARRLAFMPFLTAGDPDPETTVAILQELAARRVDLIEIGFPYSDPIADGPVIQASYTRALGAGVSVRGIFDAVATLDRARTPPLLAMVSYAIVFRHGPERFIEEAKAAGFAGFIIPDLPGDEAEDCFRLIRSQGLDLIQLVAPTTPRERVREILRCCSGFVYCIAVAGTTGERAQVADSLLGQLRWLRAETDLPLAVGFGISKPEHVVPLKGLADGVIVGSGIVRHLEDLAGGQSTNLVVTEIGQLAAHMVAAVSQP
ncbi:MAG: tryptophan synthase subunit alpha [Planctomycetaceae bacterium]|nr:tryptophan synthase subunit alpha [Planctomycetaceae bacterium]